MGTECVSFFSSLMHGSHLSSRSSALAVMLFLKAISNRGDGHGDSLGVNSNPRSKFVAVNFSGISYD